ncbi:MAG: squalene synthase [Bacteroidota bacterium]
MKQRIIDLWITASSPAELAALIKLKSNPSGTGRIKEALEDLAVTLNDHDFCYAALKKVSRSFAAVIWQLPVGLRDAVCLFYLVLRALDSIEDDMEFPLEKKVPLLLSFHECNYDPNWSIEGVGDAHDYRVLLKFYHKVSRVFLRLDPAYQEVITRICKEMGAGMAEFSQREVVSLEDYDKYCYYVAGLVGLGLSELFSASGLEDAQLKEEVELSVSMGSFLQKTNIIRDYYQDLDLKRRFWPAGIWRQYAENLEDFYKKPKKRKSLACLNHLVTDALRHAGDCLEYMSKLKEDKVFRFCAIPQVMAFATLARLYNNPDVFRSTVKIRKGQTARIFMTCNTFEDTLRFFDSSASILRKKLNTADPNYAETKAHLDRVLTAIERFQNVN